MISIQRIAVIILLLPVILIGNAFLFGYPLPLKKLPPQLSIETYNLPNHFSSKRTIDANDPVYQKLQDFLYKNRFGWRVNIVSIPSGVYTFRGKFESQPEFTIRCYKDGVVVDVAIWGQYLEFINHIPNTLQTLGLPNVWPEKYQSWLYGK